MMDATRISDSGGDAGNLGCLPKIDMLFDSENDAYEYFNMYAEQAGFFVRRSTLWTTSKNIVTRRTFVCSREGFREKKKGAKEAKCPRPETRIGCESCMTIRLTPNGRYRVTEFNPNHNHQLATQSTMHTLRAKKMRRKARAVRADLVIDPVRMPDFETEEEAYEFYCIYAGRLGFSVRRASMTVNAENVITRRMFVCSKEGFRERKKGAKRVKKPRPETRTGCPACMVIRISESDKYQVSEFVTCHNHQLAVPSTGELTSSHKAESSGITNGLEFTDDLEMTEVSAASSLQKQDNDQQDASFLRIDDQSYLRPKRTKAMGIGETGVILEYLQKMQAEDPAFFYAIQVDEKDNMTNFFWADAKSLMDFTYFGDVVCLDTTYKIYGYSRPFALFTGVNHHKQTIIFGAVLLYDDSMQSFMWLFESFRTAMNGSQPKTILTDRCPAISEAVAVVWPGTAHRFCVWHIYQTAGEQLSQAFHGSRTLAYDFGRCLFDYEEEEEFLLAWKAMLEKYDLKDNPWLAVLFEDRMKWALVYGRETFYADLKSVQQKENLHSELKKHLSPETGLLHFFEQYKRILDERRCAELYADVDASQNTRRPPSMRMLRQAANAYTPAAFKMFEKEFELFMDCMLYNCGDVGTTSDYKVTVDDNPKGHYVRFDSLEGTVTCSCKTYEFSGIQCRHVLKVLDSRNIKELPPQYILKRWRKDAKAGTVSCNFNFLIDDESQSSVAKRYNYLCRIFSIAAARAAKTVDSYAFIESQSDVLMEQVEQILQARPPEMPPIIAASCQRPESLVSDGLHQDRINQAGFIGHAGLLSSRHSHPTMCWGQFPAGPPEQ